MRSGRAAVTVWRWMRPCRGGTVGAAQATLSIMVGACVEHLIALPAFRRIGDCALHGA